MGKDELLIFKLKDVLHIPFSYRKILGFQIKVKEDHYETILENFVDESKGEVLIQRPEIGNYYEFYIYSRHILKRSINDEL